MLGTYGNRLVTHPEVAVTDAIVTFRDVRRVTADVVSAPGTAYAVPIATGQVGAAVDECDAHTRLPDRDFSATHIPQDRKVVGSPFAV